MKNSKQGFPVAIGPAQEPCYISGGITGLESYRGFFTKATNTLKKNEVSKIYNPATKCSKDMNKVFTEVFGKNPSWLEYMIFDVMVLSHCKSIYMLKNWKTSKGARWEHRIMKFKRLFNRNIKIVYEA